MKKNSNKNTGIRIKPISIIFVKDFQSMTFGEFLKFAENLVEIFYMYDEEHRDECLRSTFFKIFENNTEIEIEMLAWLEANTKKSLGNQETPVILNEIVYRVGMQPFHDTDLMSFYFPDL